MLDDLIHERLALAEAIHHHLATERTRRLCPTIASRASITRRIQWLTVQLHTCDILIAAYAAQQRAHA